MLNGSEYGLGNVVGKFTITEREKELSRKMTRCFKAAIAKKHN